MLYREIFRWTAALAVVLSLGHEAEAKAPSTLAVTDLTISRTVERKLDGDPAVPAHRIRVSTQGSVVKLTGSVDDLRAKRRAVEIAGQIRGVRSVVDQLKVRPAFRPDRAIKRDVRAALRADPVLEAADIHVYVDNERVVLKGPAHSWHEKQMATRVAAGVRGVAAVDNKLDIVPRRRRVDPEIAEDIRSRLRHDVRLERARITVAVAEGKVTLAGRVPSPGALQVARADAWVLGTRSVDTGDLAVHVPSEGKPTARTEPRRWTDAQVKCAVRAALRHDGRVDHRGVRVWVASGDVTLTGEVGNLRAKRAARQDAVNTAGVLRVHSLIKVEPDERIGSEQIEQRVRDALARDPDLSRYDLDVSVLNGLVILSGVVHSQFDRRLADHVAAGVVGVEAIQNNVITNRTRPPRPDWQLLADIRSELFWDPAVPSEEVTVSVDGGVATLSGTVATWHQREAAARDAREAGARRVRNRLELTGWN